MKQFTRTTTVHILLLVTLLATLLFAHQPFASAQGSTIIRIDPSSQTIPPDDTTDVQVQDVVNLYGVEFTIEYDPDIVQPVDTEPDPSTPGVQIGVGPVFTDENPNYFVARNYVYTDTGVIEFEATLRDPAPPFTGTGTLANITWECVGTGVSPVTLTITKLGSPPDGDEISHTVENGSIQCGDGTVSGRVLLQGRTDHSDTYVFVTTEAGVCATAADIPIPGVPYAITDADGYFEITLYDPPSPYGTPYRCLQAIHHGYLVGQYCPADPVSNPIEGDLGTITLPGGDATEDDKINIFDLSLIAARYSTDDCTADVNGDSIVDIYDLVVTAGNLGTNGPETNWQP